LNKISPFLDKILKKIETNQFFDVASLVKYLYENDSNVQVLVKDFYSALPIPAKEESFIILIDSVIESNKKMAEITKIDYKKRIYSYVDSIVRVASEPVDSVTLFKGLMNDNDILTQFYTYIDYLYEADDDQREMARDMFDTMPMDLDDASYSAYDDTKQENEKNKHKPNEKEVSPLIIKSQNSVNGIIKKLDSKIVGHNEAKKEIAKTIFSYSNGFQNDSTIGAFLLAGPSGIGKTEIAKATADLFFNGNICIVRGGDFTSDTATTTLTGAGAGLVGYGDPNPIQQKINEWKGAPGVIVFDEFDQMYYKLMNWLYSILDEGKFNAVVKSGYSSYNETYSTEEISLKNTIIFLTSNLGDAKNKQGFGEPEGEIETTNELIDKIISDGKDARIPRALFNRVKIIPIQKLSISEKNEIVKRMTNSTIKTLQSQITEKIKKIKKSSDNIKVKIKYAKDVIDQLLKISNGNARGVRNLLLNEIKPDIISEFLAQKKTIGTNGDIIGLDFNITKQEDNLYKPFEINSKPIYSKLNKK